MELGVRAWVSHSMGKIENEGPEFENLGPQKKLLIETTRSKLRTCDACPHKCYAPTNHSTGVFPVPIIVVKTYLYEGLFLDFLKWDR